MKQPLQTLSVSVLFPVFKNIAGIAVERLTDRRERGEADRRHLVVLDLGQIHVGDADALRQLVQRHFSLDHHAVQSQNDLSHLHKPFHDGPTLILIVFLAVITPSASTVTQMCQVYGNDSRYASAINVVTTLASIVTMPLLVMLLQMVL